MWRNFVLILLSLVLVMPVHAKPKENAITQSRRSAAELGAMQGSATFSPAERNLIRAHLLGLPSTHQGQGPGSLPPGLQKKVASGKDLPPGWQTKVVPGKYLDYRVYRMGTSLPDALLRRLPPASVGVETLRVENKIIRIIAATRVILDAFDLVP